MLAVLLAASVAMGAPPAVLQVTVDGSIEGSLKGLTSRQAAVLSGQIARLLRWKGDVVRGVFRGDKLAVVYEPHPGFTPGTDEEVELLAMHFQGAQITLSAYRFAGADGVARYWDESGKLVEPGLENAPLESYVQITETVQRGRGKRRHAGVDFKAPEGTPVRLPFPGVVSRVNWGRRVNGNCVEISTADGRTLHFLHLSRVDPGVKRGETLSAGAPLGQVGSTGHSNAPHLHYEILDGSGNPLDPLVIHGTTVRTLDEPSRIAFRAARSGFEQRLGVAVAVSVRR